MEKLKKYMTPFEWFEVLGVVGFTDDTVMTIAVAKAIIEARDTGKDLDMAFVECMQRYGRAYKDVGYGGTFYKWIDLDNPKPYNSWGQKVVRFYDPDGNLIEVGTPM